MVDGAAVSSEPSTSPGVSSEPSTSPGGGGAGVSKSPAFTGSSSVKGEGKGWTAHAERSSATKRGDAHLESVRQWGGLGAMVSLIMTWSIAYSRVILHVCRWFWLPPWDESIDSWQGRALLAFDPRQRQGDLLEGCFDLIDVLVLARMGLVEIIVGFQASFRAHNFAENRFFSTNLVGILNGTVAKDSSCESPSLLRDQIRRVNDGTTNKAVYAER